jgi:hypothetical protein
MAEFSTNALRNRAGPIERDPGAGGGAGCDDGCDCIQKMTRHEDDFCTIDATRYTVIGEVLPVDRSNGWARARAFDAPVPVTDSQLIDQVHCWSIASFGPPSVGANPPLRMLAKVFMTFNPGMTLLTTQILGDIGFINTNDGRSFLFRAKVSGGVLKWFAVATGSVGVEVPTGKPVALTCPTAQTLEILATKTTIQYSINGSLVATILISSVPNLIGDVFKEFFRAALPQDFSEVTTEVDWWCKTQGRLCVNKVIEGPS